MWQFSLAFSKVEQLSAAGIVGFCRRENAKKMAREISGPSL